MKPLTLALPVLLLALSSGCSSPTYMVEGEALDRFLAAGPVLPEVDQDALLGSLPAPGPYKVIRGDILEITGPGTMFEQAPGDATSAGPGTHLARVDDAGNIQVPLAGEIQAAGLTLPQIETSISEAVHPKYLTRRPSIVAKVDDYRTFAVTVMGAVEDPGIRYLRSDHMSLYGALAEAGGIVKSNGNLVVGARKISIHRPDVDDGPFITVLPVKGLNLPLSDVALRGGERIEVERYEPDTFTVVGLVNKAGAHEYPPEVEYNLMQAIAIGGGVDMIADPPYATIFRKDADGTILPATFKIKGDGLVVASGLVIKPGDVIAIQHTAASWTRSLMDDVLHFQVGALIDVRNRENF